MLFFFFFFNDTATTEIYTLSLHDALPISFCIPVLLIYAVLPFGKGIIPANLDIGVLFVFAIGSGTTNSTPMSRSEEHTSELQSRPHLVCRLLLEKKKMNEARKGGATTAD